MPPDTDLRDSQIAATNHAQKQYRKSFVQTGSKQRKSVVGIGICPVAAKAATIGDRGYVSPLYGLVALGKHSAVAMLDFPFIQVQ